MGAGGQRPHHLGQFQFRFLLGRETGVELLAALEAVFQGPVAVGTTAQAFALQPVALAAGRAALQGLRTQVDHELPGAPFGDVPAHSLRAPRRRLYLACFLIRLPLLCGEIASLDGLLGSERATNYCAVLCSQATDGVETGYCTVLRSNDKGQQRMKRRYLRLISLQPRPCAALYRVISVRTRCYSAPIGAFRGA